MKHMLEKLSGKQAPDKEGDAHAAAKMSVLHELRDMAMNMMHDKVKGHLPLHEVDVSAPDAAGLHEGLDMAKSLIPKSLNADRDSSMGEHLDSKLPHKGSNGSEMDAAAQDVEDQTELGRSEPNGDEGEPDQQMLNPHRAESDGEDDDDDMSHDEIDSMIAELQAKKHAKSKKA